MIPFNFFLILVLFILLFISFFIDYQFIIFINDFARSYHSDFFIFWKNLYPAVILVALLSLYYFWKKKGDLIPYFWISIFLAYLFSHIVKILVMRPRPYVWPQILPLDTIKTPSFPSSHVAFLAGILPILAMKRISQDKVSRFFYYIWVVLIILVGFNRLYLGVHYLSDVIAGFLIGYAAGFYLVLIEERFKLTEKKLFKNYWIFICLALLLFIYLLNFFEIVYLRF